MSDIATLASASNILDTQAKWLRIMEKAGVTNDQLQLPINDRTARRNLAAFLAAGCPKFPIVNGDIAPATPRTLSEAYRKAEEILGNDLITSEEVMDSRPGVVYTAEQIAEFEKTLPPQEELEWLRDNGYMLVAGPAKPLSLLDNRALNSKYFYSKSDAWYEGQKEKFSRDDKVTTKWLKLRKTEVQNSPSKTWAEQTPLLAEVEYVPNAAEVVWGITTYKAVRNVYLLKGMYVRTSSLVSGGNRVHVGNFDSDGLFVNNYWGDHRNALIGVSSARK